MGITRCWYVSIFSCGIRSSSVRRYFWSNDRTSISFPFKSSPNSLLLFQFHRLATAIFLFSTSFGAFASSFSSATCVAAEPTTFFFFAVFVFFVRVEPLFLPDEDFLFFFVTLSLSSLFLYWTVFIAIVPRTYRFALTISPKVFGTPSFHWRS